MAYSGATAASSAANPPILLAKGMAGGGRGSTVSMGGGLWGYWSTDSSTLWVGANYFTDAFYLGMKTGDLLMGLWRSSAGSSDVVVLGSIGTVSTAGAAMSTGGEVTSTYS